MDHVGEEVLRVSSPTLEGVFAALARGIAERCGPTAGSSGEWKRLAINSRDIDSLMVDFCNELIALCEVDRVAYGETRGIGISGMSSITLEVRGAAVTTWLSPLKAATFHDLMLRQEHNVWHCAILVDV